jgi:FkbM family methyltransferase
MSSWLIELIRIRSRIIATSLKEEGIFGFVRLVKKKLKQYLLLKQTLSNSIQYILVPDVNGFIMLVNAQDLGIGRELRKYHIHEPILTRFINSFVRDGDTILDIGSNIGYYTLLFSRRVGPNGLVIAVEPEPSNFTLLTLNLQLNSVDNVRLYQVAIGDSIGEAILYISDFSNWHSLRTKNPEKTKGIRVPLTTIDALREDLNRPINLIRMDIEGFEIQAIKGGEQTLKYDRPYLIMEVHPIQIGNPNEVKMFLKQLIALDYELQFFILRGDDFPWVKNRFRVWYSTLEQLTHNNVLLEGPEAFVLILKPKEKI